MTTPPGTTVIYTVWDGDWAILEEYDQTGARVQGYVQGYHGLVKTLVDNIYYYQDELGSTSHIADSTGTLIESYQYGVYGKPRVYNSAGVLQQGATPIAKELFTGQRWMPEIGLYDDRNRFMSPDIGRFLQPDPIGFKGDASNLYRYCGNDWANRTDPLGLDGPEKTDENRGWQIEQKERFSDHNRDDLMEYAMLNVGRINFRDAQKDMEGFSMNGHSMNSANSPYSGQNLSAGQIDTVPNPHDKSRAEVKFAETDPVYESPESIALHHPGWFSYTRRSIADPTGEIKDGKVSISQTVTATRHMPFGAGPGTHLWDLETRRVNFYHGLTNDANAAAQDLAGRGFRNVEDGIQQIRQSTQRIFNQAEKYGIPAFDLLKQHDGHDD